MKGWYTMTRYEMIKAVLEAMSDPELITIHNEYCSSSDNMDDYIYRMEEFDEVMANMKPWEIARCCFFGKEFNPCHEYFQFNGYANLESADYIGGNITVYIDDIAEYIDNNEDSLYCDEIAAILDNEGV